MCADQLGGVTDDFGHSTEKLLGITENEVVVDAQAMDEPVDFGGGEVGAAVELVVDGLMGAAQHLGKLGAGQPMPFHEQPDRAPDVVPGSLWSDLHPLCHSSTVYAQVPRSHQIGRKEPLAPMPECWQTAHLMDMGRTYHLCNQAMDGRLESQLRRWARARVPARAVAEMLTEELGINLSRETVRRWLRELPEDNGRDEAA
jgi:hypothetical protein